MHPAASRQPVDVVVEYFQACVRRTAISVVDMNRVRSSVHAINVGNRISLDQDV